MDIFDYITLAAIQIILLLLVRLAARLKKKYSVAQKATSTTAAFCYVIGIILFGFTFWLDNNLQFGCITFYLPVFSSHNLLYSGVSLAIIILAYFVNNKTAKLILLSGELLFWIYKLFLLKGGYSVGISSGISLEILFFDCSALLFRLILLNKIAQLPIKLFWLFVISTVIFVIKCNFFR